MQNNSYKSKLGISQSAIKKWKYQTPLKWKQKWLDLQEDEEEYSDSFELGSLTDTIAFTPELINDRFLVADKKLPSDAIESIVKSVYNHYFSNVEFETLPRDYSLSDFPTVILDCANEYVDKKKKKKEKGWNKTWKDKTRIDNIITEGSDYFDLLKQSKNKIIIDSATNMQAISMVENLRKNENTSSYFVKNENIRLLHQLEIFTEFQLEKVDFKIPLKGALDIVKIDLLNETIQLADLKTTFSISTFYNSVKEYSYCLQISFYDFLLREWMKNTDYKNFDLLPPVNIVIDPNNEIPYVFEYRWEDIALEADGNEKFLYNLFGTNDHPFKIKKGWKHTLEDIGWHWKNNLWEKPKEIYESGKIILNLLN